MKCCLRHMRLNPMHTISALDNSEIIYLFLIYDYCEPRTTWPPSLVVNVLDYATGTLGSIPGWAHILQCVNSFFFTRFYAELVHTSFTEL